MDFLRFLSSGEFDRPVNDEDENLSEGERDFLQMLSNILDVEDEDISDMRDE